MNSAARRIMTTGCCGPPPISASNDRYGSWSRAGRTCSGDGVWSGACDLRRSTHPFSSVIGIEIDEGHVHGRAKRESAPPIRSRPEIVCADAAKDRVPDDITVVSLYNPFSGKVPRQR